jgi:hypothetical protein
MILIEIAQYRLETLLLMREMLDRFVSDIRFEGLMDLVRLQ